MISDIRFPYGAQYYRTPNPPREDWERDLREMKAQGMNTVRLWAMWSWIHVSDDQFDFSDLDGLLELCREIGLKALIQVILENAPAWLVEEHLDARYVASDGQRIHPMGRPNTPGGGWPGLCLDNEPAREAAEAFMAALATHFSGREELLGYDIWNEVWFELDGYIGSQYYCYCDATIARFRDYLQGRYGDLAGLCKAWYRRYTSWDQVVPPRYWGGYPDWLDWIKFRLENQGRMLRWRVETLRRADPNALLVSHGLPNTIGSMATMLTDDWRNAAEVDIYGLSCFPLWFDYDADETFKVHDLIRGASAGKTFWTAETQAGPSGEGLTHSRTPDPEDIRLWNWISLAAGAKGLLYWQWRPEMLGPESPGFGLCNLNGTPTDRTRAASWFARFDNAHAGLSISAPLKGDMAILVLPESQLFCHVSDRNAGKYAQSVKGAYRAFSRAGYQVDFAKIHQIKDYPVIYLPFPLMIEQESAQALIDYVRHGGHVISEACPALFGNGGYAQAINPGYGLNEVFGICAESGPESIRNHAPAIVWGDQQIACAVHRQKLTPTSAAALAQYADDGPAVTDNRFGEGTAVLVGTYPGLCYEWGSAAAGQMIIDLAERLGIRPRAFASDPDIRVRLHSCGDELLVFVVNLSLESKHVEITFSEQIDAEHATYLLSAGPLRTESRSILMDVDGRDARLLRLPVAPVRPDTQHAIRLR